MDIQRVHEPEVSVCMKERFYMSDGPVNNKGKEAEGLECKEFSLCDKQN